eukprot:scaffold31794_cov107-Isochrysis_galbana.AAC.5
MRRVCAGSRRTRVLGYGEGGDAAPAGGGRGPCHCVHTPPRHRGWPGQKGMEHHLLSPGQAEERHVAALLGRLHIVQINRPIAMGVAGDRQQGARGVHEDAAHGIVGRPEMPHRCAGSAVVELCSRGKGGGQRLRGQDSRGAVQPRKRGVVAGAMPCGRPLRRSSGGGGNTAGGGGRRETG